MSIEKSLSEVEPGLDELGIEIEILDAPEALVTDTDDGGVLIDFAPSEGDPRARTSAKTSQN